MKEVSRDEKWSNYIEESLDEQGFEAENITGELISGPSETELVTVSLLMRLYDINMAILNHMDEEKANMIYEAHEKGEHFNPPIFVPDMNDADG